MGSGPHFLSSLTCSHTTHLGTLAPAAHEHLTRQSHSPPLPRQCLSVARNTLARGPCLSSKCLRSRLAPLASSTSLAWCWQWATPTRFLGTQLSAEWDPHQSMSSLRGIARACSSVICQWPVRSRRGGKQNAMNQVRGEGIREWGACVPPGGKNWNMWLPGLHSHRSPPAVPCPFTPAWHAWPTSQVRCLPGLSCSPTAMAPCWFLSPSRVAIPHHCLQ